jgi:hypothetical protein
LVYLAENRCKSNGAPAGAFPRPPRGRVGHVSGPKSCDHSKCSHGYCHMSQRTPGSYFEILAALGQKSTMLPVGFAELSGALAILDFGSRAGPASPQIRPGIAGIGPPGPGENLDFLGRVDDLVPELAGRGGGPLRPPCWCPAEKAQFGILISPPSNEPISL